MARVEMLISVEKKNIFYERRRFVDNCGHGIILIVLVSSICSWSTVAGKSTSHYSIHFLHSTNTTISGVTLTECIASLTPQKKTGLGFVFYLLHPPLA